MPHLFTAMRDVTITTTTRESTLLVVENHGVWGVAGALYATAIKFCRALASGHTTCIFALH
jgi:hypothetical protein